MPIPDSGDDPLIGITLSGTWIVRRVLGEGGMGRVYEARHTRIERKRAAIKVLRPELSSNPEVQGRFRREAEAAAAISHPNVVSLYDVDRTPQGWPYLVSELLVGTDLSNHLERVGRLGTVTAIHIVTQICDALETAHRLGVAHRDLKPQNVFLVGDFASTGPPLRPMVKILDFGLSRFLDGENSSSLTKTGVVMGTPSYMAPEQARGLRADHLADIYGVGALVYAMLTGRPPFNEETPHLTILAVMERDPVRPRAIEPSITEPLEMVIQRAMAKEPSDRYPDMASLKFAIEPFGLPMLAANRRAADQTVALAPRGGSRLGLEAEADAVRLARPRLVLYILLTVALSAALLATMLGGIAVLTGWLAFSTSELGLLLLAAIGTSLTPAILIVRQLRRDVWHNSARVLDLLARVRDPLLAALVALGLSLVALRFLDGVVARYATGGLLGSGAGMDWPGWNLLLPVVAGVAAGAELLRAKLYNDDATRLRRLLLGPGLSTGVIALTVGVLYGGLEWHEAVAPPPSAARPAPPVPIVAVTPKPPVQPSAAPVEPRPKPPEAKPIARASDEALATAIDLGVDGLLPLSERYPEDPQVLRALTMAFASRATGRVDAMAVAKRLFVVSPEARQDPDMKVLVTRGAETPGEAGKLAFELMVEHMGAAGPDLLYEIMLTRPSVTARARQYLEQPAIRDKATPALKIAYDLRKADDCEARLPLLGRAAQLGDERALAVLQPLVKGTKKGCGKWKNLPCAAPCAAQASEYQKTISSIARRLRERR
jgi:tRNA A-37 threonylcarbamoyl transferase component Bud32